MEKCCANCKHHVPNKGCSVDSKECLNWSDDFDDGIFLSAGLRYLLYEPVQLLHDAANDALMELYQIHNELETYSVTYNVTPERLRNMRACLAKVSTFVKRYSN